MGTQNASVYRIAVVALIMALSAPAFAQAKKGKAAPAAPAAQAPTAPATPVKAEDKVDISDLENKYWAPKDTDFSVVQNRTYTKEKRFFLTGQWGQPISDPYSEGDMYALTANYFWSERFGIQAQRVWWNVNDNNATNDIKGLGTGALPDHAKVHSYTGLGLNIVPFYAKMSFWGKKIIYFDMVFTPTIGITEYDQQMLTDTRRKTALTYGIDITQFFFFTNYFAIRADLKNQFHNQEIVKARTQGGLQQGDKLRDETIQDTTFLIGFTFFY